MLHGLDQEADSDEPPSSRTFFLMLLLIFSFEAVNGAPVNGESSDVQHLVRGETSNDAKSETEVKSTKIALSIPEVEMTNEKKNKGVDLKVLAIVLDDTSVKKGYNEEGIVSVYDQVPLVFHLIGVNLGRVSKMKLTTANNTFGGACMGADGKGHFQSNEMNVGSTSNSNILRLEIPDGLDYYPDSQIYYLCMQDPLSKKFVHQGSSEYVQIQMKTQLLPQWLMIGAIFVCLCLSGLFSGLNLGLMSLDQTELKIVMSTGSEQEKEYANRILPVRALGNFLLCSILLGNVLVNNTLTIMLDTILGGGGMGAVIGSTLAIVVFGEIIPQAICSRHGLAVGAKTIFLTKLFMFITSPLSFPISKLLDLVLGSEIGTVYNRERLMELLKVTDQYNDLEKDEVNIVTGALVLKQKCVKDVMTKLDDCYMLPINSILDFETVSEIKAQGYSRIPVFERDRTNIVHILFAKDLLFIDPDDEKPIEEVCKFYKNEVNLVYDDTILTDMFNEFKSGEKGHLAVVQAINNEGEGDPYYETVGIVTLEDIIEEIIQSEIIDETDVIIDNKSKKKRTRERFKKDADFTMFLGTKCQHRVEVSPQMSLAIMQFLSTSVRPFSPENISSRILQHLLTLDVYREIKQTKKTRNCNEKNIKSEAENGIEGIIMKKGVPCDFFVLIIEGKVEVTIGKENKTFLEGSFSYFGEQLLDQALLGPTFPSVSSNITDKSFTSQQTRSSPWIPDYTLKAATDNVIYLKVRKNTYTVALKSSRLNNMNSESGSTVMREEDIKDALVKVTDSDADFDGHNPEKLRCEEVLVSSMRTSSLRRSLSSLGSKLHGRSTTSIEKTKDEFWEQEEILGIDDSERGDCAVSIHRFTTDLGASKGTYGSEIGLKNVDVVKGIVDTKLTDHEPLSITTADPSDRTSLLKPEHSLS